MRKDINTILKNVMSKYINESETGSGRSKNPTEEQEFRYDKLDMWNAYFREHPFCIWVYATPTAKTRIPVDVMLRANFDSSFDTKRFVSLRCTLYDAPENYRKNLRWAEVEKANDYLRRPLRDRRQSFGDDVGPQEVLNKWVMEADDKYYCLIAPRATSQEEKMQLISQEFDRYQKELFGSIPESKNGEIMLSLSESQIIDMVNETVNRIIEKF